jgi:hypothetical protein
VSLTSLLHRASLLLASAALAAGFAWERQWSWAAFFLAAGGVGWIAAHLLAPKTYPAAARSASNRLGSVMFIFVVIAAALGILAEMPSLAMLVAILAALAAWDLNAFQARLALAPKDEKTLALEKAHLLRLGWVLGAGLFLSLAGLLVQIRLSLLWAMLLGVVVVFGIRLGLDALRGR